MLDVDIIQISAVVSFEIHILPDPQSHQPGSPIPPILVRCLPRERVVVGEFEPMLTQELLLFCQVIIHTGVEVNGEVICLLQLHWNPPLPEHVICVEDGLVV